MFSLFFQVNYVKAIDKYLIVCFLFVFCSLLEYAIVLLLDRGKRNFEKQKKETRNLVEKVICVCFCCATNFPQVQIMQFRRSFKLGSKDSLLNQLANRAAEPPLVKASPLNKSQGRSGFLGIQYIWIFNFRYTVFLCLQLGKYSLTTNFGYKVYRVFLNLSILHEFYRNFWYILEGLFRVFWYSSTAPWPTLKSNNGSRGMKKSRAINPASYAGYSKDSPHNSLNNKPHLQVCTSVLKQLWTGFAVCMFKPSFRDTFLGFCS